MPVLTQKAQVTVPKAIRMVLGVKPGDNVEFDIRNHTVVLLKEKKKLPFEKYRGLLGKGNTDEIMADLR